MESGRVGVDASARAAGARGAAGAARARAAGAGVDLGGRDVAATYDQQQSQKRDQRVRTAATVTPPANPDRSHEAILRPRKTFVKRYLSRSGRRPRNPRG